VSDAPEGAVVAVEGGVWVPRAELTYRATRAGGPGGQHVNTSSTRVELAWDVASTPSLTDEQRARVMEKLANRIGADGVLRITASDSRSQHQNKEAVTARFAELLGRALHVPRPRRATRPSRASKEARLQAKRVRSERKRNRSKSPFDD
jgi:ribosome-associated protein